MLPEPEVLRTLLIALNAAEELARGTVCALACCVERWLGGRTSAASLGVPKLQLDRARAVADDAGRRYRLEAERTAAAGVRIVTWLDADYPARLRDLPLPPPVLYVDGTIPAPPAIAIVGSRRADRYGVEVAERFAKALAEASVTVVSGYARGVDAAAHRGALASEDGSTVAVLGCGIDVEYPRTHRDLGRDIRNRGALVSEFPIGCEPRAHHFPIRNRLIAALASATVVVRAAARSGSLITARLALDLGRDVYAVPGNLFEPLSIGPNALIRDGAFLVQHPRDLLEGLPLGERPEPTQKLADDAEQLPTRTGVDGRILAALAESGRQTPDALAARLDLTVDRLLARLLDLELGGYVERLPGPLFARRR